MKTKILSTFGILFLAMGMFTAQDQKESKEDKAEKRKAEKIAFITTKLELTPQEAEKFWPIYNEFENKMSELHKERRQNKPKKKVSDMTDKEVEDLLQSHFTFEQKELDLKKEYHEKFKAVLPIKKVAKLYHLEMEFRRQHKGGPKPPHPPAPGNAPAPPKN